MENNQHSNNENAAGKQTETAFANNQPGQQLPTENTGRLDNPSSNEKEQHTESSKPENENETLGTP